MIIHRRTSVSREYSQERYKFFVRSVLETRLADERSIRKIAVEKMFDSTGNS